MKKDIETLDDVKLMVNTFYTSIQKNHILGPIFEEKVGGKWDEHLAKMYRFWQSILLGENTYNGAPFPPHARLPIDESHFILWVKIFTNTVDDLFTGDVANEAKRRGTLMAALFNSKIEFIKSHGL